MLNAIADPHVPGGWTFVESPERELTATLVIENRSFALDSETLAVVQPHMLDYYRDGDFSLIAAILELGSLYGRVKERKL